mmetsp:Transcript_43764/g.93056  ORF Transcript_43764/g.93056 Transcript_43764/m.93056 type:complete len:256 (-) Transcript_43764:129-896(-)
MKMAHPPPVSSSIILDQNSRSPQRSCCFRLQNTLIQSRIEAVDCQKRCTFPVGQAEAQHSIWKLGYPTLSVGVLHGRRGSPEQRGALQPVPEQLLDHVVVEVAEGIAAVQRRGRAVRGYPDSRQRPDRDERPYHAHVQHVIVVLLPDTVSVHDGEQSGLQRSHVGVELPRRRSIQWDVMEGDERRGDYTSGEGANRGGLYRFDPLGEGKLVILVLAAVAIIFGGEEDAIISATMPYRSRCFRRARQRIRHRGWSR